METQSNPRSVAQLAGARLPADRGLSSLGLLMQLVGSFFLGYMALIALMPIFAGGAPGSWQIFLLGASGAVRSAFHRNAGSALLYGSPAGPLRAVRTYAIVALIETALWVLIIKQMGAPFKLTIPLVGVLAAWPITLMIIATRSEFRDVAEEAVPQSEDMGFEGSAVLMSILGVMGVLLSAIVVYTLIKVKAWSGSAGAHGLLFLGVFMMLLVRSCMHALAGYRGTSGIDADNASETASRYYSFGVISSVIAGGALLVEMMMTAIHPVTLLIVGIIVFFLLMWPLILRRFYTERNFSVLLAGQDAPNFRRAPDSGMTALGWLLLMLGTYSLGAALPSLLVDGSESALAMLGGRGGPGGGFSPAELATAAGRSPWWGIGLALVQVWAAIELVRMSDRWRLAANVYGVVATVVTVYLFWPMLKSVTQSFGALGRGPGGMFEMIGFGTMAIFLVIPIATVVLANRKIAPTATARFKGEPTV